MEELKTPPGYATADVLRWLDQAKVLLEQTLARIHGDALKLSPEDRQLVASNLVLIANVVTHLSQHVLRPVQTADDVVEPAPLAKHPGVLERLRDIHERMEAVYHRLQTGMATLN